MKYQAQVEERTYEIEIDESGQLTVEGETHTASLLQVGPLGLYSLLLGDTSVELVVEETQQGYRVMLGSRTFDVRVADERELRLSGGRTTLTSPAGEVAIKAPIPGLVVRVLVGAGDELGEGQPVVILEAMKMENELRSPRAGTVAEIKVKAGESVEQGAELIVLE